ncbi:MAG: hypothetical protein ACI9FB_004400 [Candidatus Azotimanducaceae bacterium]|jgi:hypothetical protein
MTVMSAGCVKTQCRIFQWKWCPYLRLNKLDNGAQYRLSTQNLYIVLVLPISLYNNWVFTQPEY